MQSAVSVSHDEHELQASMKGFETFVQSLVALEPQLERTHAPPPYQSISKDRVILSVTGEILPAVV